MVSKRRVSKRFNVCDAVCVSLLIVLFSSSSISAPFGGGAQTKAQLLIEQLPLHIASPSKLTEKIAALEYAQQVQVTAKALKLLAGMTPNTAQRAWVEQQVSSPLVLTGRNPEHPEQEMTLLNVAGLANAVLFQWQIQQLSRQQIAQINSEHWQWGEFEQDSDQAQLALVRTLKALNPSQVEQLQHALDIQGALNQASNRTLSALLTARANITLAAQLYRNQADEYSYQQLAKLTGSYPPQQAIELLVIASNNKPLLSMSLLTLSKAYGNDEKARAVLIKQLNNEENAWLAATAIGQTKHQALIEQVDALNRRSTSKAVSFAQQSITEAK